MVNIADYFLRSLCICTNCTNFEINRPAAPRAKSVKFTKGCLKQCPQQAINRSGVDVRDEEHHDGTAESAGSSE